MNVLLTGVTGYVGGLLVDPLVADGHAVRGFARDPARAPAEIEVVAGDAVSGAGLDRAMAGIDVAYFLIHSMEPAGHGPFAGRERTAAEPFASTAQKVCPKPLDVGGPDTVSYGELIDRIPHHMLVGRPTLHFKRLTITPIA